MNLCLQNSLDDFDTGTVISFLFFLTALCKLAFFMLSRFNFVGIVVIWGLITLLLTFLNGKQTNLRLLFLGIVLWSLETCFAYATQSVNPTLYDTPGFLREALYIQQRGGFVVLITDLLSGHYSYFNRTPLIPYLSSLIHRPGLDWFITGKALSIAGWVLSYLGMHYFALRWFGRHTAILSLFLITLFYPIFQYQVGWIGSDLTVLGFVLLALGASKTNKVDGLFLSGLWCGVGYWSKANILFVIPVILLLIIVESKKLRTIIKHTLVFIGTWLFLSAPILINNYLNHRNPFYNLNQRYLLIPRDYSLDVSDSVGSLPHVGGIYPVLQYISEGFYACFQGFWYFFDGPFAMFCILAGSILFGVVSCLRNNLASLIPLLYAGITFLAQGMNFYVTHRFMLFGWSILIVYGSYGMIQIFLLFSDLSSGKIKNYLSNLNFWYPTKSIRIISSTIAVFIFFGLFLFYFPRMGRLKKFMNSVQQPENWNEIQYYLENTRKNTRIIDGPSSTYALEYAGFYNTSDLPDFSEPEQFNDWLKNEKSEWILVTPDLIERRKVLQKNGLHLFKGRIKIFRQNMHQLLCPVFSASDVVLLTISSEPNKQC